MCEMGPVQQTKVAGASGDAPTQTPVQGGGSDLAALLPQIDAIMASLKTLAEKLGGGIAAAVAGAAGDAEGGGPVNDAKSGKGEVAQSKGGPVQQAPTTVAGASAKVEQKPEQKPEQKGDVGGAKGKGKGHGKGKGKGHEMARGQGHHKFMHSTTQAPIEAPKAPTAVAGASDGAKGVVQQTAVKGESGKVDQAPAKDATQVGGVSAPAKDTTQVGGVSAPAKDDAPAKDSTQVAGVSAPAKDEAPAKDTTQVGGVKEVVAPAKDEAPAKDTTQVAGDSGSEQDVVAPVKEEPTQVKGDSGSGKDVPAEPVKDTTQVGGVGETAQTPPASPTQGGGEVKQIVGDVKLLELDSLNQMQLLAEDGSYLFFSGNTASYRAKNGVIQEVTIPTSGMALTLSDGSKFSFGMNDKTALGEEGGTPRDIEILGANGDLMAVRTDDAEDTSWATTPMNSFNLLEIASMLIDGSYAKFGEDSSSTPVQQKA